MLPIFDKNGYVTAWLKEERIFGISGKPEAFLSGENIFNYAGKYCGVFKDCFFRDNKGDAIAFIRGAHGGPKLPVTKMPPPPPITSPSPMKPVIGFPPIPARLTFNWSKTSWADFIGSIRQAAPISPPPPPVIKE